jgi:hypothetical protein
MARIVSTTRRQRCSRLQINLWWDTVGRQMSHIGSVFLGRWYSPSGQHSLVLAHLVFGRPALIWRYGVRQPDGMSVVPYREFSSTQIASPESADSIPNFRVPLSGVTSHRLLRAAVRPWQSRNSRASPLRVRNLLPPSLQKLHLMANCSTRGPLSALMTSSEPNPCRGTK